LLYTYKEINFLDKTQKTVAEARLIFTDAKKITKILGNVEISATALRIAHRVIHYSGG